MAKKPKTRVSLRPTSFREQVRKQRLAIEDVIINYSLRGNAREIIRIYELQQDSKESRRILKLALQQIFLATIEHKTVPEEKYLHIIGSLARLEYALYKYPGVSLPLGEGKNVYLNALGIMKFLKENSKGQFIKHQDEIERGLNRMLASIKYSGSTGKSAKMAIFPSHLFPVAEAGKKFAARCMKDFEERAKTAFAAIDRVSFEQQLYDYPRGRRN